MPTRAARPNVTPGQIGAGAGVATLAASACTYALASSFVRVSCHPGTWPARHGRARRRLPSSRAGRAGFGHQRCSDAQNAVAVSRSQGDATDARHGGGGKTAATRWQRTAGATHILVATSEGGCGFRTQTAVRLLVAERDASQSGEVERRKWNAHTRKNWAAGTDRLRVLLVHPVELGLLGARRASGRLAPRDARLPHARHHASGHVARARLGVLSGSRQLLHRSTARPDCATSENRRPARACAATTDDDGASSPRNPAAPRLGRPAQRAVQRPRGLRRRQYHHTHARASNTSTRPPP